MKFEQKQESKVYHQNVFEGMPSLLNQNGALAFQSEWPVCKILPQIGSFGVSICKLENPQKFPVVSNNNNNIEQQESLEINEDQQTQNTQLIGKQNKCGHTQRKHYAKKLCMPCYFRIGRQRKATNCKHTNKTMHAKGLCSKCYQKWIKKCNNTPAN